MVPRPIEEQPHPEDVAVLSLISCNQEEIENLGSKAEEVDT
jgi:hypothetical protein